MSLPLVTLDSLNERQHRTNLATAVNELIKVRPPNDRTEGEVAAGITPIDYTYPYLHVDRYATFQEALNALLANGGTLQLEKGKTYALGNTNLTLIRTSASHAKRMIIEGNGATVSFSGLASGSALKVGADGTGNFVEGGLIEIRNITLQGPETGSTLDDDPSTTTVGLELAFAGSVQLDKVKCPGFHTGFRSKFAFPVKAVNCSGRQSWVGWWMDEATNLIELDNFEAPNCRYSFVIKSESTSLDSGKSNNISFRKAWVEGSRVGWAIDSGTGGAGAVRHRSIAIYEPYVANVTYDVIRIGREFTFSTPDTRGSNCSEFINDFRVFDGLWNPSGGAWSATSAAICYDSAGRVKHAFVDIPVVSKESDSDVFVNGPYGGVVRTRAYPGVSDGIVTEYLYNNGGSIARRLNPNGDIMLGSGKATSETISETGLEMRNDGSLWSTTDGAIAHRLNRKTSTGIIQAFYQAGNFNGYVTANAANIYIVLDATNNVGIFTGSGSPEGVVTAGVGSTYHRTNGGAGTSYYVKETGTGNTGWVAK